MTLLWGISNNDLAAFDKAVGSPALAVRDYTTLDTPQPARWKGLATGRELVVTSMKWKKNGKMVAASGIPKGSIVSQVTAYGQWLIDNQLDGCFDHEIDAKTAAAGGTPAELDAAFLYCLQVVRDLPGWNRKIYAGLTGWDEVDRGKLFKPILDAADGTIIDQYATTTATSFDAAAGEAVDWLTVNYPLKPIVLGEWGTPQAANRAAWMTQAAVDLQSPRYRNVIAACWWNAADPGFDCTIAEGSPEFAAWVAAAKLLAPQDPNIQLQLQQLIAEVGDLQGQLAAAVAGKAALQSENDALNLMVADARAALAVATS